VKHGSIDEAFNVVAQEYDAERRLLVPCFDAFYGHAVELVADAVQDRRAPRILDLGAGTGLLSALLANRLPHASFYLVDLSDGMLEQARRRFERERPGRFTFETADLSAFDIQGQWDAIVSALAIHHLEDNAKQRLYLQMPLALTPRGMFVNAEQVLGSTPWLEARYEQEWVRAVRAAGASEMQIERAKGRMAFDRSSPLERQLEWLRNAGFVDVDCVFKDWRFAVIAARV
jgi:ubiquinone/menaquinone biosynthesis C-methylase UbiE